MAEPRVQPETVTMAFIACINRGDAEALGRLMTDDHSLHVFD